MSTDYRLAYQMRRLPLARGQACQNCRRRKIKCDGIKPTCTACSTKRGLVQLCSYKDPGMPRTRALESQIAELQERILELESRTLDVPLHKPYENLATSTSPLRADSIDHWSGSASPGPSVEHFSCQYIHDPPKSLSDELISNFLPHAKELCFFLDIAKFQVSASRPLGHPGRPCPALLAVVHLWGLCLSPETPSQTEKIDYLTRSLHTLAEVSASGHHGKLLYRIQTEALLVVFFFNEGNFMEGKLHAGTASALAIDAGLHQRRGAGHAPYNTSLAASLSPPADSLEEGEYIDCFWTLYTLENTWTTVLQSPLGWGFLHPDIDVATPWPLEDGEYKEMSAQYIGSQTVRSFLDGSISPNSYGGQSPKAMLAKAAVLFYNASRLEEQCRAGRQLQADFARYSLVWQTLVGNIERLTTQLSPMEHPCSTGLNVIFTHALVHAANMKLQGLLVNDATSRDRILDSACAIFNTIPIVDSRQSTYINPIFGFLWVLAGEVILRELTRLQRYLEHDTSFVPTVQELSNIYYHGLTTMTRMTSCCLLRTQWGPLSNSVTA